MARVVIKSGFMTSKGGEKELAEFMCDWPDCPNIATRVLGCVKELGLCTAVCDEHAPRSSPVHSPAQTLPPDPG